MRRSLTRRERLQSRSDLQRAFTSAANAEVKGIKLLYLENQLAWNRIAVCPVRGFKKAVERNREKRICREAYRHLKHRVEAGYDLVFVLYPGEYGFRERLQQVETVLGRAGLKR